MALPTEPAKDSGGPGKNNNEKGVASTASSFNRKTIHSFLQLHSIFIKNIDLN